MADFRGVRLVPHAWGTAVPIAASLQFVAALLPDPPRRKPVASIFEFGRAINPSCQAIADRPLKNENGRVEIPDSAGLRIEIDRDPLQEFAMGDAR